MRVRITAPSGYAPPCVRSAGFSCAGSGAGIGAQGILAAMTRAIRRWMLGIGAALLIGGWGMTRYADARQLAMDNQRQPALRLWTGRYRSPSSWLPNTNVASRTIFGSGVVAMAVGAGLIGFAIQRPRDRSDENRD